MTIRKQFPIQLACACTIHRTQGLTMEALAFDPSGINKHGLAYTTLSCTITIDTLFLLEPLTQNHFKVKKSDYRNVTPTINNKLGV